MKPTHRVAGLKQCAALALAFLMSSRVFADSDEKSPLAKLEGSEWLAVDIDGTSASDRTNSTIRFKKAGKIEGNSGCHTYSTTLSVDGDKISFADIAESKNKCRVFDENAEKAYIAALKKTASYSLNHYVLRFSDADGDEVVKFRRLGTPF